MIGYIPFAPTNQKHSKDEEGMYANLKRQVFNLTHELDDTESTTFAPTADNHLELNDNTASIAQENATTIASRTLSAQATIKATTTKNNLKKMN
ncbi:hypothetical protein EVAR_101591_1 [Eumeta japonica]|uniref:Uncharacterized protein n=1 Tax=Eumeta variegata TaxID=151549 RepID=A0A4C1SWA8_EUMVA|nr:hypothetical protein EVAR_101591_1 [Eumeta japonica]